MFDTLAPFRRLAIAFPLAVLLAGCSGGGGGSAAPGGGSGGGVGASLFFDTAAGSESTLEGQLAVAALESPDGSLTGNLLPAAVTVSLARPDGESGMVSLRGVTRGPFVALHLLIADGSLRARTPAGAVMPVEPTTHALRLPFERPLMVDTPRVRIEVRHAAPLELQPGPGGSLSWDPNVDVVPTDVVRIRFGRVDVVAIDRPAATVTGILVAMDERPVAMTFASDALLLREPFVDPLTEAQFLDGLVVGTRLLVDGLLDLEDNLVVSAAVDLGPSEPIGRGRKGEIEARILEVLPGRDAVRVAVLEVEKGEHLLPDPTPHTIVVDGAGARIKWVPRHGRHRGHLPFSALEAGMVVEVSWHGAVRGEEIDAEKIDIRSRGTCFERGFEGSVTAVSIEPARLELRLDPPAVVRGREIRDVAVEVGADTLIARGSGSTTRLVGLEDVQIGENARVIVEEENSGRRFEASLILLEWR